ncbi:MAG: helix-turn-helix domain-containing protein [Cyanobacteria bacterium P01_D01_bin.56]
MTHKYQGAVKPQPLPKSARHYRLTNDEWLRACTELKPAEMKVLYYLRTLDPWGDKNLEISVTDIAKTLKCNKGTISRALKALDTSGWIDLEINTATVKLHTKNSSSVWMLSVGNPLSTDNTVVSGSQSLFTDNFDDRQTTPTISRQHSASETHTQQDVQIALNSLKLTTPTTQSVCVSENAKITIKDSELKTEIGISDRQPAQVKNAGYPNQAIPTEQDIYTPPILLAAKKKFEINLADPHLRRALERWPERIEVAISCLEEKELTVKHPTRFLQKAIEEQWQPEALAKEKAPDEFREWFKEARERGLVVGSQRVDGQIMVYTVDERCVPFNDLRQLSWDALTAQLQAFPDDDLPVNTCPPEQSSALEPESEPPAVHHRVKHAAVNQTPIAPLLQADADSCHIDIPLFQAEWELAASPPGAAADDIRQVG